MKADLLDAATKALRAADTVVAQLVELEVIGPFESRRSELVVKEAIAGAFIDGFNLARGAGE